MKYARIIDDVATNVTTQDPYSLFPAAIAAEFENVPDEVVEQAKRALVGVDWVWTSPEPPPPYRVFDLSDKRLITRLAFRNRFTTTEKVTIEMASLDNPSGTQQQRQLSASLRVYLADVNTATFIDLDRVDTRNGVLSLETYGIIAAGRALEILDAPILSEEKYIPT